MKINLDLSDSDLPLYQRAYGVSDPTPFIVQRCLDSLRVIVDKQKADLDIQPKKAIIDTFTADQLDIAIAAVLNPKNADVANVDIKG